MRRAGLLFALATMLASSASPAAAHPLPAGCNANRADLTIASNRPNVRPGRPITFTVSVANQGAGACDITGASVNVQLPAANGTPTGELVPIPLPTTDLPAGFPMTAIGTVNYVANVDAGVTAVTARVSGSGVLHDAPVDSPTSQDKTLGTTMTRPGLEFTFEASPLSGFAPFSTTYEFRVKNASTTDVPMGPPVIQHTSCPAAYASGDAGTIGELEINETWRYTCSRVFPMPDQFMSNAVATAPSKVDNEPVVAPTSDLVTVNAIRPPAATLELSRTASPRVGPAPLTATHTYTLRNTSGADPRPVRNPTIDDALCAPVARTPGGDDLLTAGETWTYSCTQTLATAGTISGTAVASGPDDLGFGTLSSSNLAEIELEATAVNPGPTPVPTASATPTPTPRPGATPTPTPTATPTPSTRVNFATTSGRIARCTTRSATAQLKVGSRLIASKRIKLDSRCRYRVRFTNVTRSRLRGATRVSVTVRSGRRTATHRVAVPKR